MSNLINLSCILPLQHTSFRRTVTPGILLTCSTLISSGCWSSIKVTKIFFSSGTICFDYQKKQDENPHNMCTIIWFLKLHDIHSLNDVCKYKLGFDWKWYSFVMLQIPEIRVWQTSPWHIPFFWPDISDSSSNTFLGNVSMS